MMDYEFRINPGIGMDEIDGFDMANFHIYICMYVCIYVYVFHHICNVPWWQIGIYIKIIIYLYKCAI